jgi:hypothetical protein
VILPRREGGRQGERGTDHPAGASRAGKAAERRAPPAPPPTRRPRRPPAAPDAHPPAPAGAEPYGAAQLWAYTQTLNDWPSLARGEVVASLTTPTGDSLITVGLPWAIVEVVPPWV